MESIHFKTTKNYIISNTTTRSGKSRVSRRFWIRCSRISCIFSIWSIPEWWNQNSNFEQCLFFWKYNYVMQFYQLELVLKKIIIAFFYLMSIKMSYGDKSTHMVNIDDTPVRKKHFFQIWKKRKKSSKTLECEIILRRITKILY